MALSLIHYNVKQIILCALMGLLLPLAVSGQNRIATVEDQKIYGDYIEPGDLIIDSPNRVNKDKGQRDVFYYFMPRQWPGLRDGATIWIDGERLGAVEEIKFANTSNSLTQWHIESLRVKNIPHTQVVANSFVCEGLKHFELDGESPFFPGLARWPASRKFLTGSFGFRVISDFRGGHGYTVNVRDGGTIKLNGFEVQHGFSGVRINGGKYDITLQSVEISNFYIHDTGNGEGQYLGAAHKPPLAKIKNLKIHHGIIARTAAEALQLQHLAGGTDIHNVTIYAADVKWMKEFMAGQDTGIQWCVDGGENYLHHVIVDGYASMGLVPFGSAELSTSGVSKVSNVLFNDGRDTGMYLHKSGSFGIHWVFDSIYFRGIVSPYYSQTGRNERDYFVSRKHGTDRYTFTNIFHDGSKPKVFENPEGIEVGKVSKVDLPPPVYENSGFHEPAHKIKQWHAVYGGYFPISKQQNMKVEVSTQWDAGDIAIETEGEYAFFKCRKTHVADTRRPGDHPFFIRLSWDANGVRSDQPGWKSDIMQSSFPPDDLRLVKNNHWRRLGMGFQEELMPHLQASQTTSQND